MMRKRVLFIANSLDNAYKFHQVLQGLNVDIAVGSTLQAKKLASPSMQVDLVIFEASGPALSRFEEMKLLAEGQKCPLLVIVSENDAEHLRFPTRVACDFVTYNAGFEECALRIRRLLGEQAPKPSGETIAIDDMTINLATYQVTIADDPVDFTYLEYALLAFLIQHPDHAFSRDALLQNVWGFDYYGGSRTVDVHVRRIRSKLGPHLAQYLKTVRSVGYLWDMH